MQTNNSKLDLVLLSKINDLLDNNVEVDDQLKDQVQTVFGRLDELQIDLTKEDEETIVDEDLLVRLVPIFYILNDAVIQPLLKELEQQIANKFNREPKYPVLARIKTCILFFFCGNGNLTRFHRDLLVHQEEWGAQLGYHLIMDELFDIPSYKCIHQFLRSYLGTTIYNNFESFVKIVMQIARQYKFRPGWRSIFDSTPHESTANDKEASYSGHYEMRGYKEHRLIGGDTDIPLAFKVTTITEYDGNHAQDLLDKALDGDAAIAELWFDQHYASYENLTYYELQKNMKTHYRIAKNWKLDSSIDEAEINRMYQRLFEHQQFLVGDHANCSLEFQLKFIWEHSTTDKHRKAVGMFLRNQAHQQYQESPKQYLAKQGFRSKIEGGFGVEKSFSILKLVIFRGIKSWKALISIRNFIDLIIAIFRMDLGQKTKLTSWKGIFV